jgi:hypothetical protein
MKDLDFISVIGYLIGVAGAVTIIFSRVKNENIKDLKERVEILEKERKEALEQHLANQKAISLLEGKLESYKEIPLRQIDDSLSKIATSNQKIFNILKNSADILKAEKA